VTSPCGQLAVGRRATNPARPVLRLRSTARGRLESNTIAPIADVHTVDVHEQVMALAVAYECFPLSHIVDCDSAAAGWVGFGGCFPSGETGPGGVRKYGSTSGRDENGFLVLVLDLLDWGV
jgi:hypothetical protein